MEPDVDLPDLESVSSEDSAVNSQQEQSKSQLFVRAISFSLLKTIT